jgi:hypothetical protein
LIQLEVYSFMTHSLLLLEDHKIVAVIAVCCSNMTTSVSPTLLSYVFVATASKYSNKAIQNGKHVWECVICLLLRIDVMDVAIL